MKSTDRLNEQEYVYTLSDRYILDWPSGVYDESTSEWLTPAVHPQGYLTFWIDGRRIMFHRLVYAFCNGAFEGNIDHLDGDVKNNHPDNLRCCTQSENTANSRIRSDNKSGYKGTVWHRATNKWQAQTMLKGKRLHLGLFIDKREAALVYNYKLLELFGPNCVFNKVF